jgi:hypothetical protein
MTPPARALHYAKQRKLPAQHLKAIQNADYLLYRAALPVPGRKYRSFNYARTR